MFETDNLKTDARRQFKRASSNLKKEVETTARRKLPFNPKSKVRTYHSTRRLRSSVYVPRVYMRTFTEEASKVITLPAASRLRLPNITAIAPLENLIRKNKQLRLSSDKQYVLYWKNGKSIPVYQINTKNNTVSLKSLADKEFEDIDFD